MWSCGFIFGLAWNKTCWHCCLPGTLQEAVKRWFDDTMQEAQRGSVKEMALLGQMYMEGYGVHKDHRAAKE
jgi:TPR repeat protein